MLLAAWTSLSNVFETTRYTTKRLGASKVVIYRSTTPIIRRGVRFVYGINIQFIENAIFDLRNYIVN